MICLNPLEIRGVQVVVHRDTHAPTVRTEILLAMYTAESCMAKNYPPECCESQGVHDIHFLPIPLHSLRWSTWY